MARQAERLRVVLSADIEFDINGALTYPRTQTPRGVESVFRECVGGDQGLGFLVDTLDRHGLVGSFFVETLAARHFGVESIRHLVDRIGQNGQTHEIELHVHPEWQHLGQDDWRDSLHTAREQGWRPNPWLASLSPSDFESLLSGGHREFPGRHRATTPRVSRGQPEHCAVDVSGVGAPWAAHVLQRGVGDQSTQGP